MKLIYFKIFTNYIKLVKKIFQKKFKYFQEKKYYEEIDFRGWILKDELVIKVFVLIGHVEFFTIFDY